MIVATRVSVGNTAVALVGPDDNNHPGGEVLVRNRDATNDLFLGGPNVTTGNGYLVSPGQEVRLTLHQGDALYGIASVISAVTHVLRAGA